MAEVDDLSIKIEASADKASKSIDKIVAGLEKMQKALGFSGDNVKSISSISSASQKAANSMKAISSSTSKNMESVTKQTKKASESIQQMQDRIMKSAREKATVEVDYSNVERETKKWENQLRNAQNALSQITSTESALSQAKGIERYSAKIAQAELAIKKLQESMQTSSVGSDIEEMMARGSKADVTKTLDDYERDLQDFDTKIVDMSGYEQFSRGLEMTFESLKSNFPNAKDTIKRYEELISEVNETFSSAGYGKVDTSNISNYIDGIDKQKSKISSAAGKFSPVQLGKGQSYTQEYSDLQKQIDSTSAKMDRLIAKQEKFDALGVKSDSQKYKSLQYDMEKVSDAYKKLTSDAENMEKTDKAVEETSNKTGSLGEKAKAAAKGTSALANVLRTIGMGKAASTLQKVSRNFEDVSRSSDKADGSISKFKRTAVILGTIGVSVAIAVKAFKKLASVVANVAGSIVRGLRKIVVGIAAVTSGFLGITKGGQLLSKNIHRVFMALASRLRSMAVTATTDNMGESFDRLSKHSQRLGTNMAQLKATLATIGAQFVAAFEPVLSFVLPALNALANGVLTAINALSQLIASLTGQSTYIKATANVNAYADATSGAAKAQKELNKQLQGVDELNNLTTNDGNKGGSGGSGSGNGVDYTDEKVPANIANLAEKIKKAWDDADFTEIGSMLAEKLAGALDSIDWSKIQANAAKVGKSLATLINGFVEFPELPNKVGTAIGEAVNTVVSGLDAFLSNVHFGSIGTFIGTAISTALQTVDWKTVISDGGKIGKGIADFINSLVDTDVLSDIAMATANLIKAGIHGAYEFVTNLDFGNLGEKIGDAINSFFTNMGKKNKDTGKTGWEELGVSISESLSGITETISTALKKIDRESITNAVSQIWDNIDSKKIKDGFIDLIEASLKLITGNDFDLSGINFTEVIVSAIFGATALKAVGGIISSAASSITKSLGESLAGGMAEVAKTMFEGLGKACATGTEIIGGLAKNIAGGITTAIGNVGTFLTTSVTEVFAGGAASIAAGLFAAIGAAIAGWNIGQLIYDKFSEQIDGIVTKIGDFFTQTIPQALSAAGTAAINLAVNVKGNIDEKAQQIKDWFSDAKETTKNFVANIKAEGAEKLKNVKEQWENIKKGTKKLKVSFTDSVSSKLKKVKNAWDGIVEKAKKLSVTFTDNFTAPLKKAWNAVAKSINSFIDKIPVVGSKIADVPTFPGYANGGFPQKYSVFMAGENGVPEIAGTVGGKTAVAGGAEITGIRDAIYSTSQQEMEYLRTQNQLLQGILEKEFGITKSDIGKASRDYARDYYNRTGRNAYVY